MMKLSLRGLYECHRKGILLLGPKKEGILHGDFRNSCVQVTRKNPANVNTNISIF